MKEVFWTPLALNSLEQTEKFIRKVWNQKVIDEFYDLLELIKFKRTQILPQINTKKFNNYSYIEMYHFFM